VEAKDSGDLAAISPSGERPIRAAEVVGALSLASGWGRAGASCAAGPCGSAGILPAQGPGLALL